MDGYGWAFIGLSVVLMGTCVSLLFPFLIDLVLSAHRMVQIKGRFTKDTQEAGSRETLVELLLRDLCTNGLKALALPAQALLKTAAFAQVVKDINHVFSYRVLGCNTQAIAETLIAACLASGLLGLVLTGQLFLAALACLLPVFVAQMKAKQWIREQKSKLREQLPDALRGLGMCFMAGLSLEQAFDQMAAESKEPLKRELQRTVDDIRTGSSIAESLDCLDARLAIDEMRFVSVALEIQHSTGGSMREVLDAAADSMLASFDLSRSLEVQTSQARLSAQIVSILPLALVAVLSLTMEGYLATFFSSPTGFSLLLCALVMELAGIFVIRRILGIDLE